ncbi:MAG: flagellin, partial [Thaumarchaeota archaeon]|nr:flagellin [Nitrososphaerota archaeon]
ALAFVVLNMGFSTTQKAKTAITSSVTEASSALEISGKVTGIGYVSGGVLNATIIPLKVAGGGDSVSLDPKLADIKYYSNTIRYDNIYKSACVLSNASYTTVSAAVDAAVTAGCTNADAVNGTTAKAPATTQAIVYWDVNTNDNNILDQGEHANLVIQYKSADRPAQLDNVKAEVVLPTGSALTVERQVPAITTDIVDLG